MGARRVQRRRWSPSGRETTPRLALQFSNGESEHPEALQIGFDEADVVNLIAVPVAALLAGRGEG